jgi:hypothetical protein
LACTFHSAFNACILGWWPDPMPGEHGRVINRAKKSRRSACWRPAEAGADMQLDSGCLYYTLGAKVLQLSRPEESAGTGHGTAETKPLTVHFEVCQDLPGCGLAPSRHHTRHVFSLEQRSAQNDGHLVQQGWLRAAEHLRAKSHGDYAYLRHCGSHACLKQNSKCVCMRLVQSLAA